MKIVHRAHLKKSDFEKYGFTDRCPGCSAIIRGLRIQPHAEHCRRRMEALLKDDLRIKNAKTRLEERGRRLGEEEPDKDEGKDKKRRKLKDIEKETLQEQDPAKLGKLFEEYRVEYQKREAEKGEKGVEKKKRKTNEIGNQQLDGVEAAMMKDDFKRAGELYEEYLEGSKRQRKDDERTEFQEVSSSSRDPMQLEERAMEFGQALRRNRVKVNDVAYIRAVLGEELCQDEPDLWDEYAWDDVNGIPLPVGEVRAARREEMAYMKGKKFQVVKRGEAIRVTGRAPISTKWVDTDKGHGVGKRLVRSR